LLCGAVQLTAHIPDQDVEEAKLKRNEECSYFQTGETGLFFLFLGGEMASPSFRWRNIFNFNIGNYNSDHP
jgi:hypothetical protein